LQIIIGQKLLTSKANRLEHFLKLSI